MMPLMMLIMNLVSVAIIWFGGHCHRCGQPANGRPHRVHHLLHGHYHGLPYDRHALHHAAARRCGRSAHRRGARHASPRSADPEPGKAKDALLAGAETGCRCARIAFNERELQVLRRFQECVLEHVRLHVRAGQDHGHHRLHRVSGKSTVHQAASERFHDVTEGSHHRSTASMCATVSQHALRATVGLRAAEGVSYLSGTVASNVGYAVDACR